MSNLCLSLLVDLNEWKRNSLYGSRFDVHSTLVDVAGVHKLPVLPVKGQNSPKTRQTPPTVTATRGAFIHLPTEHHRTDQETFTSLNKAFELPLSWEFDNSFAEEAVEVHCLVSTSVSPPSHPPSRLYVASSFETPLAGIFNSSSFLICSYIDSSVSPDLSIIMVSLSINTCPHKTEQRSISIHHRHILKRETSQLQRNGLLQLSPQNQTTSPPRPNKH